MFSRIITLFSQRNSLFMLLLGFASGLPLALTSGTLQAWMTVENVDLKTIGFFSLVGQAYVFKFLWSPLMDRYTPPFLGRRRGWLILSQLLLIAAIIGMGFMNPARDLWWLAILAILVAFCSASQDIVFDAYKTDLLPPEERGTGAATSVLGYRLAMLVSGGLALWMADRYFGWQATYWLMAGLMLIGVFAALLAPEPLNSQPAPRTMEQAIVAPLRDFFARNNAWLILLLIVLYKLGDAFAISLTTTFLIRGVGFNAGDVGIVNKTLGLFATIVGAIYGGLLMQRLSLFRALMLFGILQAVSNAGYWLLAITDKSLFTMASAVFLENLCGGMGTAAFVALLMTLCNKSFSATQFALLSALAAVGRVYVGPIAGWFVESYGWAWFYLFSIFAALPGLAILMICRDTLEFTQKTNTFQLRTDFQNYYNKATHVLGLSVIVLVMWLILLISNALEWSSLPLLAECLLAAGGTLALLGIFFGSLLDYLSLRRASKQSTH
ncbi:muropeptide MFS transporter AmpG [Pectobacterium aquaticum]|uniref:Muropeptide MFS transporter AmpG n=1 Tax=Pectobacterium aquaticum TaxID=2204145 RepID=A0A3R8QUH6_9GAMM|nr:muropeptide MFS transporter AmpG [Pectobacterium aquaticum]MCH5050714.1 muropeptide MFS transporter AmpG [Pectobacterium aquaticum]RRO11006.1 muropeptide MFS transporter AmpG [Pectobacterium aquaticum]